jgi:hypothetical protein
MRVNPFLFAEPKAELPQQLHPQLKLLVVYGVQQQSSWAQALTTGMSAKQVV